MSDIENPMVVDSLWRHQEETSKVLGSCDGCGDDILEGQDIYEFHDHTVHSSPECCRDYIANISICKVAGR